MATSKISYPQRLDEALASDPIITKAFLEMLERAFNLGVAQGKEQEKK